MKTLRLIVFGMVALFQLGVPARVIINRSQTFAHGAVWKFRTAPIDPVDVVRGHYIALRFVAEEFSKSAPEPFPGQVWAVLKKDAEDFAVVDHLSATRVAGNNSIEVKSMGWSAEKQRVRFPFDRFWVSEANGPAADRAYAERARGKNPDAYVTVRVREGDAVIEQLYLGGQPLPEYLRDHPAQ